MSFTEFKWCINQACTLGHEGPDYGGLMFRDHDCTFSCFSGYGSGFFHSACPNFPLYLLFDKHSFYRLEGGL